MCYKYNTNNLRKVFDGNKNVLLKSWYAKCKSKKMY